jgi:curli biogenesis system outer membrane secretion channel CsgG
MKLARLLLPLLLTACATQSPQMTDTPPSVSEATQKEAQTLALTVNELTLKRKIAVGRLSNETTYGKSLLNSSVEDKMAMKITDMFVQSLLNSGNYLIFERPDISLLQNEQNLTGQPVSIVGVDTLVIGSLTEFGRTTTGQNGFLSSSKKQEATATIDLRLVDTKTGQVFATVTGTGKSSTETSNVMGFGSVSAYDGSLNDQAIGTAVNAAVAKLSKLMLEKPWTADILDYSDGLVYISGGASQGIKNGMQFLILEKGKEVKSQTTGVTITLPGKPVGKINIEGTFGQSELEEGSYGSFTSGGISGSDFTLFEVREDSK